VPQADRPNARNRPRLIAPEVALLQSAAVTRRHSAGAAAQCERKPGVAQPVLCRSQYAGSCRASACQSTFRGAFAQQQLRGRRHRGIVIGWVGPVFWPYAYSDVIDYTFWPYAYDTFWPYAYDDVYTGIFGSYAAIGGADASTPSRGRHGRSNAVLPGGRLRRAASPRFAPPKRRRSRIGRSSASRRRSDPTTSNAPRSTG